MPPTLATTLTAADASHFGVSKLSVAPAAADCPVAVGTNDPRLVPPTVQAVQHAGPLVGGTYTLAAGITVTAESVFAVYPNNLDPTAAHWGALTTGAVVVGGPGVGSVVVNSSNAADTSGFGLLIFG